MGLLSRLLGLGNDQEVISIAQGSMDIVGESHYQSALASIAGPKCEDGYNLPITVELRREPNNPYDGNAVACFIDGKKVGHINRQDAARLQSLLKRCEKNRQKAVVDGYIVGGWSRRDGKDQGDYGVKLHIT